MCVRSRKEPVTIWALPQRVRLPWQLRFAAFSATFQPLPQKGYPQQSQLFFVNWTRSGRMAQTVGRTAEISMGPGDLLLSFGVEGLSFTQLVPCKAGKMNNSKQNNSPAGAGGLSPTHREGRRKVILVK